MKLFKGIICGLIAVLSISGSAKAVVALPSDTCGAELADVVIMLDRTGSIDRTVELPAEASAAKALLDSFISLGSTHKVAVGAFGQASSPKDHATILPGGGLSTNYSNLKTVIDTQLNVSTSGTNIESAVTTAVTELATGTNPLKFIVILSDGQANHSLTTTLSASAAAQQAAQNAKNAGIRIITIAYDSSDGSTDAINGRALLALMASNASVDNTSGSIDSTERDLENGDGDDFYVAPSTDDLAGIFAQISDSISCNDNNDCTLDVCNDTTRTCSYSTIDNDNDGTADCTDACGDDPLKIEPGQCGCDALDTDSDGDGTADCNDQCDDLIDSDDDGISDCLDECDDRIDSDSDGSSDCVDQCDDRIDSDRDDISDCVDECDDRIDTDQDGIPDCKDECDDQIDSDDDGISDCLDQCDDRADKDQDGISDCVDECNDSIDSDEDGLSDCVDTCDGRIDSDEDGISDCLDTCDDRIDTDDDGYSDCVDGCDEDYSKSYPGVCGCGVSDANSDEDESPNCFDQCPEDSAKVIPGECGCGVADTDADSDGVVDCSDSCTSDPYKSLPGQCGCGVPDTDRDSDGTADCLDACVSDPAKVEIGACGCGVSDVDANDNGTADCLETPQVLTPDTTPVEPEPQAAPFDTTTCDLSTDTNADGLPDALDADLSDFNADGIPDCCTNGNGSATLTGTDTDGDGLPDCREYALGTNPSVNDISYQGSATNLSFGGCALNTHGTESNANAYGICMFALSVLGVSVWRIKRA